MKFVNLGTRNKGLFWEYLAAHSFITMRIPGSAFTIPSTLSVGEGLANKHCHDPAVIDAYCKDLFWKELDNGVYTSGFFQDIEALYRSNMQKLEEQLHGKDLGTASNEELAQWCTDAVHLTSSCYLPMLQALFTLHLEKQFTTALLNVLSREEQKDPVFINQTKATLLTTPRQSFADVEENTLYELEKKYWEDYASYSKENLNTFLKKEEAVFEKLVSDFGWFHMEYMQKPLTKEQYEDDFGKRLMGGSVEKLSPLVAKEELRQTQQEFFAKHPDVKFKKLTEALQGFAFILDDSKVVAIRGNFVMMPLLTEAAKRLGITWDDILLPALPEIVGHLQKGECISKERIHTLRKHRALLLFGGEITTYAGEEAVEVATRYLLEEETDDREVKGTIAFPGIVRGKVVIINSILDRNKFKPGDIMVTHDGSAELTVFLKQAGAIVTNEGGMICHAAIVAREVKTPCIVGTKNATKVLQEGDMVEVDATKGVVSKLQ